MADMVTAEGLIEMKKKHPGAVVVCYINSSVEVKAESDVCCTSSNAVNIVKKLKKKILYLLRIKIWLILLQSRFLRRILYLGTVFA